MLKLLLTIMLSVSLFGISQDRIKAQFQHVCLGGKHYLYNINTQQLTHVFRTVDPTTTLVHRSTEVLSGYMEQETCMPDQFKFQSKL